MHHLIPSVLAAALLALLLTPMAALGASGLPATITMSPEHAGPGSTVEVVGIDFPGGRPLELRLTTTTEAVVLAETTVEAGGYFRHIVTFPEDVSAGFWELRATTGDGRTAVHSFESLGGSVAAPVVEAPVAAPVTASGGAGGTPITLVVLALLFGGLVGASIYVWGLLRHPHGQQGMSSGEDPIWASGDEPVAEDPILAARVADPILTRRDAEPVLAGGDST